MAAVAPALAPVARLLLAFMFILAGFGKLGDIAGTQGYMEFMGVPGVLIWPTIALQIVGGLFILAGFLTRPTALLFAGFCILSGVIFHLIPSFGMDGMEAMSEMNHALKNFAIAGGFLALVAMGPGAWAIDTRGQAEGRARTA